MHCQILTLFPEMFPGTLGQALAGKALTNALWKYTAVNPRDFATDRHKTVDDTPYGGGAGMVMRPDILSQALESLPQRGTVIVPSPRGVRFTQEHAKRFAKQDVLTFICGRYEGIDQRFLDAYEVEEVSLGDYILSGGEIAVQVMIDAVLRCVPAVLGNDDTHVEESFSNAIAGGLEYPHYTRPAVWSDPKGVQHSVPDILRSGHHAEIKKWRLAQSQALTAKRRPDLV